MAHTPHELAEEFPEAADKIHALKETDAHFSGLAEQYHTLNRAVHRAETNVEPTDDFQLTKWRKERLVLKDQISAILAQA